jgi:DNA polymerase-3 subunit delta'
MSFRDAIQTHPDVAGRLQRCLQRGRLAHAWLFTGPADSGREAMARTLAKALNCDRHTADCCPTDDAGRCDSCRRVDSQSHPDVYWVRPESKSRQIRVEQMRALEYSVCLKPTMARVKVGIVVDADCMNEEASNAFLKTLEEPPGDTVILLLTSQPQRLLTTIRSRCLKLSFGNEAPVAPAHRQQLIEILARFSQPGQPWVVGRYNLLASLTALLDGLKRDVQSRIEQQANLDRYEELEARVREKLEDQLKARIEGDFRGARERVIEDLYRWFADILLCVENADPSLIEHPEGIDVLRRCASGLTYDQALANLAAIDGIRDALARNVVESFALEAGILKLCTGAAS